MQSYSPRLSQEFKKEVEKLASIASASAGHNAEAEVEAELEAIFGDTGKAVLLLEFAKRYDVTPGDAIRRPAVFGMALYYMIGELGSRFVMDRISSRIVSCISPKVN